MACTSGYGARGTTHASLTSWVQFPEKTVGTKEQNNFRSSTTPEVQKFDRVSSAQTTSAGGATAARGVVAPPQEGDPLPKPSEPLTMHRPKKLSPLSLRKKDKPEDTGKSPWSEITTPRSAREQVAEVEGRASRWSADSVLSTRYPLQPLSGTPLLKRKPKRQLLDRCDFFFFSFFHHWLCFGLLSHF